LTRKQAATDAGLSEHRRKTAIRVSRVPDPEFEGAVEADDPATVTSLAQRGTVPARVDPKLGKEAQIRAMREAAATPPTPPISQAGARDQERDKAADELHSVLLMLRGDRSRITSLSLAKRVDLARACLSVLDITLDDLRAAGDAP
jgi:hypothetical protein